MSLKLNCKQTAETLGQELLKRKFTIATAESCTGGMIGAVLTAIPGSSAWFKGGIIAYDDAIKIAHLRVPETVVQMHGAVSEETVAAMAQGVANILQTDCAIAVSGIAGPGGGTKEKPVGLVYSGVYCTGTTAVVKNIFSGDREAVREQTVAAGLRQVLEVLATLH